MDPIASLRDKLAALPDAVYLQRQAAAVDELPSEAAMAGARGTSLGAPRRIEASHAGTWWALVLNARTPSREAAVPWHTHAMVVAVDVDRGTVLAGPALPPRAGKIPDRTDTEGQPPPNGATSPPPLGSPGGIAPSPEASSAGLAWLDVPSLLGLPRRNARLAVRVIDFDQPSNVVVVERLVDAAPLAMTSAAEAATLAKHLRRVTQSGQALPSFQRGVDTPALPGPGVAFTLARRGSSLPLHAAVRVELAAPMVVEPSRPAESPPPAAVVRAALLVLRKNVPRPYVLPIEVPVWSDHPLSLGTPIEAAFAVDLAAFAPAGAAEPGAQVYLLAGRHLAGPRVVPH